MPDKKLLIIKTGSTLPELLKTSGDFEDWIIQGLEIPKDTIIIRNVEAGDMLPPLGMLAAAVITGSHAMVSDRHHWSEVAAGWLRVAVSADLPILGICYGHQLLSHALGGTAETNPLGPEYGTVNILLSPHAKDDPLFKNMPQSFPAQACHFQSAITLPKDSVVLASSDGEPHHAYRVGACCYGVQFHPEFSVETTRAYIRENRLVLSDNGKQPDRFIAECQETVEASSILKGFAELIRI